jgi:hypothetical protein
MNFRFSNVTQDVIGAILILMEGDFGGQNRVEFSECRFNQRFLRIDINRNLPPSRST